MNKAIDRFVCGMAVVLCVWFLGCMEQNTPAPKPPVLANQFELIVGKQQSDIAALAQQCALLEPDHEVAKKLWNTSYSLIVGNSTASLKDAVTAAFDKTPDKPSVWKELSKAYE